MTCSVAGGPELGFLDDGSPNVTVDIEPGAVFNNIDAGETAIKLRDENNTVNVGLGATLTSAEKAIEIGDNTVIDNQGSITSAPGEDAIQGGNRRRSARRFP